jgi:uncharacterized protein
MDDLFEWDADKAESNLKKHGVSFEEAATVFNRSVIINNSRPVTLDR